MVDLDGMRPRAFAIAYRLLGSVSEAEDVVQEALLRLHGVLADGDQIDAPDAYLATVVTRVGIDRLRSAQRRRETYVGEWLPEPVLTDGSDDPAAHAEMSDSLSLAFLVLLERLSPEQRAVFLLREVFDYDYAAIAAIIGKSEVACRQLAARARRHIDAGRPRFESARGQHEELARRFFAAAEHGDLVGLEALLASDVELTGDGGGKAPALARTLRGRPRVARAVLVWIGRLRRAARGSWRPAEVNGEPGAVFLDDQGRLVAVCSLGMRDGEVTAINSVVNPDKLRHLGPVGDLAALLGTRPERALTTRVGPPVT